MDSKVIVPHGDYTKLASYKKSVIVYDGTALFCERFFHKYDRTREQMVQAARSGSKISLKGAWHLAHRFVSTGGLTERMLSGESGLQEK